MKNLSYLIITAGIFAFVACGPSQKEKEQAQRLKDSLLADSIEQVEAAKEQAKKDSIAIAEKEKRIQDSILAAEEAAKTKKGVKK